MPRFWIWKDSDYARITQGGTIWLNISEQDGNMPEYGLILNNRQGSEYVSHINEHLLRDCVFRTQSKI